MKRFNIIALLLLALATLTAAAAEPSAADILASLHSKMSAAPSLKADFTINSSAEPVVGTAYMNKSRFKVDTPQLAVWYDGHTQWTFVKSSSEVNITEPEAEELASVNPFAVVGNYQSHYTARRLPDDRSARRVELKPKAAGTGIDAIVLAVSKTTGWPTSIRIVFDDNRQINLSVNQISTVKEMTPAEFTYNPQLFPAAEIIDLR